ncbi:T9SS type A sorting domain-containing protein [candidate division TA06 bacterium]|nr:T9SS type A sorting domain-containing protein [candidate division TA06 bacterium]
MVKKVIIPALLLLALAGAAAAQQIIADHNAVAAYAGIPQQYIDSVKTWWVTVPGESHSSGYRIGLALLEAAEPRYAVNIRESGTPDSLPAGELRFSRASWGDLGSSSGWRYGYGEEDWYTSQTAVARTAAGIRYCNTNGRPLHATGFGWCWDMTWINAPGGTEDPVYQVRWAGSSEGGPQGSLRWGLDAGDSALTGNSICMDTYLAATQLYIDSCHVNGWPTTVFYTTGPVDGNDNNENGYQREIKHQYLRDYVQQDSTRVLFDYADILCWGNDSSQHIATWNDSGTPRNYPQIHADNMLDTNGSYTEDGDHIGQRGSIRLAKAMWWMLARLAGWDGTPSGVTANINVLNDDPGLRLSVQPNPFRGQTVISYILPRAGEVELAIYNSLGQRVRTLVSSRQEQGTHTVTLGYNDNPAGVYFCRLRGGGAVKTSRMVLMK